MNDLINKTNDLLTDETLTPREKMKAVMDITFSNVNNLLCYNSENKFFNECKKFGMYSTLIFFLGFFLFSVTQWLPFFHQNFSISTVTLMLIVFSLIIALGAAGAFSIVFICLMSLNKKWLRTYLFHKEEYETTIKQWKDEQECFNQCVNFLNNNVNVFTQDDLNVLAGSTQVPSWVNCWSQKQKEALEKHQSIERVFGEESPVKVSVEKENPLRDSRRIASGGVKI